MTTKREERVVEITHLSTNNSKADHLNLEAKVSPLVFKVSNSLLESNLLHRVADGRTKPLVDGVEAPLNPVDGKEAKRFTCGPIQRELNYKSILC